MIFNVIVNSRHQNQDFKNRICLVLCHSDGLCNERWDTHTWVSWHNLMSRLNPNLILTLNLTLTLILTEAVTLTTHYNLNRCLWLTANSNSTPIITFNQDHLRLRNAFPISVPFPNQSNRISLNPSHFRISDFESKSVPFPVLGFWKLGFSVSQILDFRISATGISYFRMIFIRLHISYYRSNLK